MARFTKEVAEILSSLELHQIKQFAGNLSIEEVKIVQLEVLPKIMDLDRKRYLKKVLADRENKIYESLKKSEVITNAIQENKSVSNILKSLHEDLKAIIIDGLANDEARTLFLERATEEELFILNRKLLSSTLDEKGKRFYIAVLDEIKKRKGQDTGNEWKDTYSEQKNRKHKVQIEANFWQSIIKNIQQANLEALKKNQAEVQAPVSASQKPWYSIVWSAIKSVFSQIGSFFSWLGSLFSFSDNQKQATNKVESETVTLTDKEKLDLEQLRSAGAQRIASVTGVVALGKIGERTREQIELSMRSRFGMALAAQVVAGTVNEKHRKLMTAVDSLVKPEDDNDTIKTVYKAIRRVTSDKPESYPIRVGGEHIYARGANSLLVTAIESEVVSKLAEQPEHYSQLGIELSEDESEQINLYHENMERSKELTQVMQPITSHWGGYSKKGDSYIKVEKDFDEKQKDYKSKLALAGKLLQKECTNLKPGQSLYLDTGLEGHAMQLVITRIGNEYKLSTYDSSGALENTSLMQGNFFGFSPLGLLKLNGLGDKGMRRNAYTFTIPRERLHSAQGLDYLSYLIQTNTMAGWAQSSIELNLDTSSMTRRADMGYFERLNVLNNLSRKYTVYKEKFASIASQDSPPYFEELLQRPQNTQNCFAKKAQSCQLYELGRSTYKKVRLAVLLDQKENLIKEACGKIEGENEDSRFVPAAYSYMIESIEPQYLSPSELYEASTRLAEVREPPSPLYYQHYFAALIEVRNKLANPDEHADIEANQLTINRINDKIAQHAKELYLFLSSARPSRQEEIKSIFAPEVYTGGFDWNSGVMPLKEDPDGSYNTALRHLSDYSSALAWKSIIQIINHQIKKLSVNERSLSTTSDRLPHASYRTARYVTLNDLENANIVNFTTGFFRTDEIKVEINIAGERYEIDKETFFQLVVQNKEALTNPKVMGLLDYLRNASQELEKRYTEKVYPEQSEAFEHKLDQQIMRIEANRIESINRLYYGWNKLENILVQFDEHIVSINNQIKIEQENIGEGKNSIKLKNLKLRHDLLQKEKKQVHDLHIDVSNKIQELNGEKEGSARSKIDQALQTLGKLRANTVDVQSINARSQLFIKTQFELERVDQTLQQMIKDFEVNKVEKELNVRIEKINEYRQSIVANYLQTNAEYRILDELSAGRMGTEKNKNKTMYSQTAEERIDFFKQGKNDFQPGSIFQEIQSLNQRLKIQVQEIVELKALLKCTNSQENVVEALQSANDEYIKMDKYLQEISKEPIPQEIKNEWVRELFVLWLKYENPERLYIIQNKNKSNPGVAINQAFHHFIEQKANVKYAAIKEAGYPIYLTMNQIEELGWKPISALDIEEYRDKRKQMASLILKRLKQVMDAKPVSKVETQVLEPIQLQGKDLMARHGSPIKSEGFVAPNVTFLSQSARETLDGGTLKFLRTNPMPIPKGEAADQCEHYFAEARGYLHKLKAHTGLENKDQRITEFCHSAATRIFNLPYPPPQALVTEIANTVIDRYRDDEGLINEAFLKLENNERSQILTSLIKLHLSRISEDVTKVNTKFYSTIKQWEKLITPPDAAMSDRISSLTSGGTEPEDINLLKEVDSGLHESPIGLEGLYEGQKGLQIALTSYGAEKGVDSQLRKLADRLGMRNGDALLAHQFINYYSNKKLLLSSEGINSAQGREVFSRALLDAYKHAKAEERQELLNFLQELKFDDDSNPCKPKAPHQVFIEEVLIRCSNIDPESFKESSKNHTDTIEAKATELFISTLTKSSNDDGVDRLFGFAKQINTLSIRIDHALQTGVGDSSELDVLYSELICANLAYRLILDQASEEELANINHNFEYTREMSLVQSNINKLQDNLVYFTRNLSSSQNATLGSVFSDYVRDKKFDGPQINSISPSSFDIPGFISLGRNKSLDVLHGVIYIGNHKLGVMPAYIQSNITLQELGINSLPFKPQGGGYVYIEGNEVKASITQLSDGELIIQRELRTFDGTTEMLQYISPDKMGSIPISLSRRVNAEHFFIDSKGSIHAYSADFTPILKLSNKDELWSGILVDHHGNKISIDLEHTNNPSNIKKLSKIFPQNELLSIDKDTVYIPAIAKYVIHNDKTGKYVISDSLTDSSSKRHLTIKKHGSAYTERVLLPSEDEELKRLNKQLEELKSERLSMTKSDLLSNQAKIKIEKSIRTCESRINEIISPEYFVFVPDSAKIKALEEAQLKLREEMQHFYVAFREGGKEKEKLAVSYEHSKETYLEGKNTLKQAYAAANHMRIYRENQAVLYAKDFQSILHVGIIPGKTEMLTKLLGANVPKSPLKPGELEELRQLKAQYKDKVNVTMEDRFARIMMIGIELQHHLLEREAFVTGKLVDWNRKAYQDLLNEFTHEVNQVSELSGTLSLEHFSELWRAIQSEFISDKKLQALFTKPVIITATGEKKPINIKTKTTNMPIESIGGRAFVEFTLYEDLHSLIDAEQIELEQRLHGLDEFRESVKAQEDGYYYENYGLFNSSTLEKLFSITPEHNGINGLTKNQVSALFKLMEQEGWIRPIKGTTDKYQVTRHPSEFFSATKIASYLTEIGYEKNQIRAIAERMEIFLYQTVVSGGRYSIKPKAKDELILRLAKEQEECNIDYLLAADKIESVLATASVKITFADLNSAYLLNDYSRIISYFPEKDRKQNEIILNNGMTRLLYYKTESDHLNDVQSTFKMGQEEKAVSMLHIRRNYSLEKLLDSEAALENVVTEKDWSNIEQERKMQRAFLLFESEFGHRCNARQVSIFRGLLLDDEINPDKIDSAQARMGFGKTTLLPLVALYKTGEKLVRFIVPKSALETNTADISATLSNMLGSRAIKDEFQRYRIASDPEPNMGEASPRLKSLQDIKADLKKKLALYQRTKENREVLVQAPSVRNSMECQAEIFLDLLLKIANEPLQEKELMECISVLNEIRSIESVSIFDELDATQDSATTDVNYTVGEKIPLDTTEIYPLELITLTISETPDRSVKNLAKVLLERFKIEDDDGSILKYITSLEVAKPHSNSFSKNSTSLYLMRAVLTDPVMLSIFTEKEPGTDFGVWFENASDGSKSYDYEALKTGKDAPGTPLLISVPYAAANTPKPQGSRFDNPEVTAITTLLYYLDPRTEINEVPHLEFLINSFRNGLGEAPFLTPSGDGIEPEFKTLFAEIKALAEIEDPIIRNAEREKYFAQLDARIKNKELPVATFRKMLARTIIQEQIKFDAGKANSNRYEQGTTQDKVIGFSGTASDTSSYFKDNMLDPAADGNMTLGIMGRANCQVTIPLNTTGFAEAGEDYTISLIKQLSDSFLPNTRAIIDVGGLCKASNRSVAKEIAMQLKTKNSPLKGVIFYDDVTNTKKLLTLDDLNKETIVDLTQEMVTESDRKGSYFTYYDQSHSRGADIKQMDGAHAVLTLNFTVTNNNYKQAIMRMRKIIDKLLGQSFSTAVPDSVREQIISDLGLDAEHSLTGNDIAFWLRQKELENDLNNISVLMLELDSVVKNAILQQQAEITKLMSSAEMTEEQIEAFRECIRELNTIHPFISGSINDLEAKYGRVYGTIKREDFVRDLKESFEKRLTTVFDVVNRTREHLDFASLTEKENAPYRSMAERIIRKRESQLSEEFNIPSANNALSEVQSETENQSESQSESQSQSQTQTHSFSEVTNEEVVVDVRLRKHDISLEPLSIDYLSVNEEIAALPSASEIAHMQNLFNESDPISCSHAYMKGRLGLDYENPLPPVHYFLVREEGTPKVILINQDEANLFKAKPIAPWSLYNIRARTENTLMPVAGPNSITLKDPLLKKLNFAAFRHEIKGEDISSLAKSFEGICTPEQLQPSLNIEFKTNKNASKGDDIFTLPQWGFYGRNEQNIQIKIEQTQITFKDKYEKRGVTISVGTGEDQAKVFISSKLNNRILAEMEKPANDSQPMLKKVAEQIKKDYRDVMDERALLRGQLNNYKNSKKMIIDDFDKRIADLEKRKADAVSQAKTKMASLYVEGMKGVVNLRDYHEKQLDKNINSLSRLRVSNNKEWGTRIGWGSYFNGIAPMVVHFLGEIQKADQTKSLSQEELNKKINEYTTMIFEALSGRYELLGHYSLHNSTMMEAMHAATNSPNKDIKLWTMNLNDVLKSQFNDLYSFLINPEGKNDDEKYKVWGEFATCIEDVIASSKEKNLSFEDFDQKMYEGLRQFAVNNKIKFKNPDAFAAEVMNRLSGSFTPGPDKQTNLQATKSAIVNIIYNRFLQATQTPSEVQRHLYTRIHENISNRKPDFNLPAALELPHPGAISKEELSATVQELLTMQNIHVTSKLAGATVQRCARYIAGYKWLEHNLEHFMPVKDRSPDLGKIGDFKAELFPAAQKELARLDEEVSVIQQEIDEAKIQKAEQLEKLENQYRELPGKIQSNKNKLAELKGEKSALNKLLSGINKLLLVFTKHQVTVVQPSAEESTDVNQDAALAFLGEQFNLGQIIRKEVSSSATLTFIPPELYDVEDDLNEQLEHLHGLDEIEAHAKKDLDRAISIVRSEAELLRTRECTVQLAPQTQQLMEEERVVSPIEISDASETIRSKTTILKDKLDTLKEELADLGVVSPIEISAPSETIVSGATSLKEEGVDLGAVSPIEISAPSETIVSGPVTIKEEVADLSVVSPTEVSSKDVDETQPTEPEAISKVVPDTQDKPNRYQIFQPLKAESTKEMSKEVDASKKINSTGL